MKRSVDVVKLLAAKYGSAPYNDTVTMLELLNEPTLWLSKDIKSVTKQYYIDAYQAARRPWGADGDETSLIIVFHDGFQEMKWWDGFMENGFENVWIDDHYYQAFSQKFFGISAEEHLRVSLRWVRWPGLIVSSSVERERTIRAVRSRPSLGSGLFPFGHVSRRSGTAPWALSERVT